MKTKTKKHWFDRVPKLYRDILVVDFKSQCPGESIKDSRSFIEAYKWSLGSIGDHDFYCAIHLDLEKRNEI